jgi:hypothetical protein
MNNHDTDGAETIDGLTYLPDPAYPYPFPVAQAPHFWMTEQSGALAAVVESYFQGEQMSPAQGRILASYLHQYVSRAVLLPGVKRELLLQQIARLRTQRDFEVFADELAAVGIEPF